MKKTLFLTLLVACISTAFAQQDAQAKQILDQVSAKSKAYETIRTKFSYVIENKAEKLADSVSGMAFLKGSKYKLFLLGSEIIFDGKTLYNYNPDVNEVTISTPDPSEPGFINPADLFTIYQTNFKYRYIGETTVGGKQYHTIDLFPSDPGKKPYHTIKLKIDKAQMQVAGLKYMGKDGTNYTIDVLEMTPNTTMPDQLFNFDSKSIPGIEVTDMRK